LKIAYLVKEKGKISSNIPFSTSVEMSIDGEIVKNNGLFV